MIITKLTYKLVPSLILVALGLTQAVHAQKRGELLTGVYFGEGTMFNHSYREILKRGDRVCIKIVDGPASPYRGREEITVSSVSLSPNIVVDADQTKLEVFRGEDLPRPFTTYLNQNVKLAFFHTGRTYWVYKGESVGKLNPQQSKDLIECINSTGVYQKSYQGDMVGKGSFPSPRQRGNKF